jgi:hypothetical protein
MKELGKILTRISDNLGKILASMARLNNLGKILVISWQDLATIFQDLATIFQDHARSYKILPRSSTWGESDSLLCSLCS